MGSGRGLWNPCKLGNVNWLRDWVIRSNEHGAEHMGSRFVRPDTTVLKISDGDTLTVKRRLTSGEQRACYARMYLAGVDGQLRVNPMETGLALVTAYLVDWSLTDDADTRVEIRGASIDELTSILNNLDHESFVEIKQAIEAHEVAMVVERTEEKKRMAGATNGLAISPSRSGPDGASNTSETLM